jgi:hypothetical protein
MMSFGVSGVEPSGPIPREFVSYFRRMISHLL